jgi:Leucine-rich repeat (LRR) protein
MADKTIKVKVDVEPPDVEPSIANLKALKRQIKDTAAGSEEFLKLQQQIDDVQDSLASARKGAGNFADVLGGLPGPIGTIGNQASGLITSLKQLGQLKLSDVKSSFVELGKDLVDVASGIGNLTGLTKLYTVTNQALSKSFIAIGVSEGIAAAGARALAAALIATGIGALVVLLGTAASMMYEMATGTKAAEEAAKRLNNALESQNRLLDANQKSAANRNKVTIAQMKAAGKSEKEIRDFQIKSARKDYDLAFEAEKEARALYNKSMATANNEDGKKLTENLRKREQETKDAYASYLETGYNAKAEEIKAEEAKNKELAGKSKAAGEARLAERKRELEELRKGLEEARLATLSEKDKEVSVINSKYDALKALAVKYGKDTKIIEQARADELLDVSKKYAKEDREKKQKELDDSLAAEEQQLTLRVTKGEIIESEYQQKLFDVRREAALKSELLTNETLQKEQEALKVSYDSGKLSLEEYTNKKTSLEEQALSKNKTFVAAEIDLEKYRLEQKKLMSEGMRGILLSDLQSRFEALDKENARIDGDFEQDLERIAQQKEILAEQEAIDLQNTELTEFQKTEIRKKYADQRIALSDKEVATEKAAAEAKHAINMAYLGLFQQFGNLLSQIAGKNKGLAIAGVVISQAAAIGQIIANTAIANAKSVAASPLTVGQPWVAINTISAGLSIASTIASAAKSIQQINSVNESSSGGAAQGAGGGASLPTPPSAPTVAAVQAPQIQTQGGNNPTQQLGETIGAAKAPLKAYVVSGEVTSQQALDRRTSRAATFSGG